MKGKIWRVVKKINKGLSTRIRTRYGKTRSVDIPESIRQGGVLSVIQFSKMMDMLNEMLEEEFEGYRVWYGESKIACLLFMDDAIIVEEDPEKFQTALNIAKKCTMVYKLALNKSKSKVMIINQDESDKKRLWKIGNTELEVLGRNYITKWKT